MVKNKLVSKNSKNYRKKDKILKILRKFAQKIYKYFYQPLTMLSFYSSLTPPKVCFYLFFNFSFNSTIFH